MRPGPQPSGRKILPQRHQLPGALSRSGHEKLRFCWVFLDGTGFADQSGGRLAARRGNGRSSAMLFALGAAATALNAVSSLASSSASPAKSSGFSAVDPFEIASPVSASTSSAPASGFSAGSQISPATLNTLLAAQSQSSTASNPSAPTSASEARQDISSQIDSDAGSSDSSAAASSYNLMGQMFQRATNAFSFSAPPLSFSA
jgi:hypothetical protein